MNLEQAYTHLVETLEQEITLYRTMLDIVRREHEILANAKMDDLLENNKAKDALVLKMKSLDRVREKRVKEIVLFLNIKADPIRLLDIAAKVDQQKGDKLRAIHTTLDLIVKRIKEHNDKNEIMIQAALRNISGALENLKSTLEGKETYQPEGTKEKGPITTGRFVSREA